MFTVDRRLEIGSWLDYGYFLEAVCVAARANGLDTCSQQAFAYFHTIIREQLALDENEVRRLRHGHGLRRLGRDDQQAGDDAHAGERVRDVPGVLIASALPDVQKRELDERTRSREASATLRPVRGFAP